MLQVFSKHYELKRDDQGRISLSRRAAHPKFVILCYHRIGMGGIPLFSELSPDIFEAQMRYIRRRYRVLSLDDLCDEMENPSRKGDAVAITFDDGYRDLYTHALPVLRKYQIPSTIYLPVTSVESGEVPWYDRIFLALNVFPKDKFEIVLDRPRSFPLSTFETRLQAAAEIIQYLRSLPDADRVERCVALGKQISLPQEQLRDRMLTWDQIRDMCREGVTFGSHTMTHPAVSRLAPAQLAYELNESKRALESRIGRPAVHFAYPFGKPADCGRAAAPLLASNGYRSAATTVEGANEPGDNRYELRRSQVGNERTIEMFAFKLNQLFLCSGAESSATTSRTEAPVLGAPLSQEERRRQGVPNA